MMIIILIIITTTTIHLFRAFFMNSKHYSQIKSSNKVANVKKKMKVKKVRNIGQERKVQR